MTRTIICRTGEIVSNYNDYLNTTHWKHIRSVVRKKYNFKCVECGSGEDTHVHHMTYENIGHEKINDLILLCNICHKLEHEKTTGHYKPGKNLSFDKKIKLLEQKKPKVEEKPIKVKKQNKIVKKAKKKKEVNPLHGFKATEKQKRKILEDKIFNKYGELSGALGIIYCMRKHDKKFILKTGYKFSLDNYKADVFNINDEIIETIVFRDNV